MTFFYDLNKRLASITTQTDKQVVTEGAKPDFLDIDKDGNKKEPMKQAARQAKEVDEGSTGDYSAKKARAGKDIGKPGKQFAKIAKSAGEKYGSKERGEKVAGAVLAKLRKGAKESVEEAGMEEGNDFTGARLAAIKAGKPTFSVAGKTYKVTGDTSDERMMEKKEKTLWPGTPEYEKKFPKTMKTGEKSTTHKGGEVEKTATGIKHTARYDDDAEDTKADDGAPKRRGRPKGSKKAMGAKFTGKSKLLQKSAIREEGGNEAEIEEAIAMLKDCGYTVTKDLEEKAVSKAQQRFMGMVHAAQKGEKAASPEVAKVAKEMPKKAAKDFAKTKHKGLPEKVKAKKDESVEETAEQAPKASKGGFQFGKGIYDSFNRDVENLIAESMNISMNMSNDASGGPSKSLTVSATDEDAVKLGELLKMAGLGGGDHACDACGQSPCGCEQMDETYGDTEPTETKADWPTNTETSDDALQYSGGLNKPKETGQTTVPIIASQEERQVTDEDDAMGREGEDVSLGEDDAMGREGEDVSLGETDELARIREMAGIR